MTSAVELCVHGRSTNRPCPVCARLLWVCDHEYMEPGRCAACIGETTYFGFEGEEFLSHTTVDDVIVEWLEDTIFHPDDERLNEPMPRVLRVHRLKRMEVVPPYDADRVCEFIYEPLDELHADPDGDRTDYAAEALIVAQALIDVVTKGYTSWACVECGFVDVNVRAWLELNEPDLLKTARWQDQ